MFQFSFLYFYRSKYIFIICFCLPYYLYGLQFPTEHSISALFFCKLIEPFFVSWFLGSMATTIAVPEDARWAKILCSKTSACWTRRSERTASKLWHCRKHRAEPSFWKYFAGARGGNSILWWWSTLLFFIHHGYWKRETRTIGNRIHSTYSC